MNACRACHHSFQCVTDKAFGGVTLMCELTAKPAEFACAFFIREAGTDIEEYLALQDGHPTPERAD